MANRRFAGSSCAKASIFAEATVDQMEDRVFFDIATKWQLGDKSCSLARNAGVGLNGSNRVIQTRPAASRPYHVRSELEAEVCK